MLARMPLEQNLPGMSPSPVRLRAFSQRRGCFGKFTAEEWRIQSDEVFLMGRMLGHAFFGLIIGLLARAVLPGRQHMGIIATMVLGMIGAWLGGLIGRVTGMYH